MNEFIEVAHEFARALDAEDYESARKWLAPDCIYEFRDETIQGADAILSSYSENGASGRGRFDTTLFESSVSEIEGGARIDYPDIVTLAGDPHRHRCAQTGEFDDSGLVTRIRHIDIEGEREALRRFEESHA